MPNNYSKTITMNKERIFMMSNRMIHRDGIRIYSNYISSCEIQRFGICHVCKIPRICEYMPILYKDNGNLYVRRVCPCEIIICSQCKMKFLNGDRLAGRPLIKYRGRLFLESCPLHDAKL